MWLKTDFFFIYADSNIKEIEDNWGKIYQATTLKKYTFYFYLNVVSTERKKDEKNEKILSQIIGDRIE